MDDAARADAIRLVREQLLASAEVKRRVASECLADMVTGAEIMARALSAGGKVLLCGNGGSAADCQHMATEFVSRLTIDFERPGIAAIALTTDTSFLTAFANDIDFQGVFARQVATLGRRGDVLIAISTSGRSANVLLAAETARTMGISVIALIGKDGTLAECADVAVRVPTDSTQLIQESHLAIEHGLVYLVERLLYGK